MTSYHVPLTFRVTLRMTLRMTLTMTLRITLRIKLRMTNWSRSGPGLVSVWS